MKIDKIGYIQKLSDTFIDDYIQLEIPNLEERCNSYFNKLPLLKENLGGNSSFFFGNSHDSKIIDIKEINQNLHIKLDDFSTKNFAYAFNEVENINIIDNKIQFPFTIVFHNIKHFSLNTVSKNGKIRRENKKYLKEIKDYLYEEFVNIDKSEIEILLNVWLKKPRNGSSRWLLLIACEKIEIIQNLDKIWIDIFGEKHISIFQKYMNDRNSGQHFGDYSKCLEYLQK